MATASGGGAAFTLAAVAMAVAEGVPPGPDALASLTSIEAVAAPPATAVLTELVDDKAVLLRAVAPAPVTAVAGSLPLITATMSQGSETCDSSRSHIPEGVTAV